MKIQLWQIGGSEINTKTGNVKGINPGDKIDSVVKEKNIFKKHFF